jgi:hypothetical protein
VGLSYGRRLNLTGYYEDTNQHRDFMEPNSVTDTNDYFGKLHFHQEHPEFTVRDLNCLLAHERPIPQNLYSMVRGSNIFDRIESYKTFLEEIRL